MHPAHQNINHVNTALSEAQSSYIFIGYCHTTLLFHLEPFVTSLTRLFLPMQSA